MGWQEGRGRRHQAQFESWGCSPRPPGSLPQTSSQPHPDLQVSPTRGVLSPAPAPGDWGGGGGSPRPESWPHGWEQLGEDTSLHVSPCSSQEQGGGRWRGLGEMEEEREGRRGFPRAPVAGSPSWNLRAAFIQPSQREVGDKPAARAGCYGDPEPHSSPSISLHRQPQPRPTSREARPPSPSARVEQPHSGG